MRIGELVWVRNGPQAPTWGIVINELVVYLTDNSVMVSYEVLVDSIVWQVDVGDVLRADEARLDEADLFVRGEALPGGEGDGVRGLVVKVLAVQDGARDDQQRGAVEGG